jgi:hypothetical protein
LRALEATRSKIQSCVSAGVNHLLLLPPQSSGAIARRCISQDILLLFG